MLDIALQNLWQKKLRTVLTILGIAVCANLFIVVTSIANFMTGDLNRQAESFKGQIIVQARSEFGTRGGVEWPPISSSVSEDEANAVIAGPNLRTQESTKLLFVALAPPPYPGGPPEILAVGAEPGREDALLHNARAHSGRLTLTRGDANEAIIGIFSGRALADTASETAPVQTLAGKWTLPAIGSTISVRDRQLRVVGIMDPDDNQLFRSMLVVPLTTAQELFNREGQVSAALLTPQNPGDLNAVADDIEAKHPLLDAETDDDLTDTTQAMLSQQKRFMDVLRATAVAAAALLVTIVMFVAVLERTRELGTLRAIGAPSFSIILMVIIESLILVLAGTGIGIPISIVSLQETFKDGSGLVDREVWIASLGLLLGVGLVASLLPAWHASRVDPVVAIRYE
jgi:putative ABC transport system permease protein